MSDLATGFLDGNDAAYRWLLAGLRRFDARRQTDAVLRVMGRAASFACWFHTGRFADGGLENAGFEIGANLDRDPAHAQDAPVTASPGDRRRVLHVATAVQGIGGHTRMIDHWVRNDRSSVHSVVVTDQGDEPIPPRLREALDSTGGRFIRLPSDRTLAQKALLLRELSHGGADLVVLHHFGYDVVPIVAFAVDGGPPVALLNQGDHVFWLGSSVADTVISLRTAGAEHAAERRFSARNVVLPIPLAQPPGPAPREEARRALGIPGDQVVLLSVGRPEKYRPSGRYDFVATAGRILERNAAAHLYVVGESADGIAPFLRSPIHDRLHFAGSMEDPSTYRAAADVYLESFPFGSQTALLEAALDALPVVRAYAPLFPLLVSNDDAFLDILPSPVDEADYVARADLLSRSGEERRALGDGLRDRLLEEHVGGGWVGRLSAIYRHMDGLRHAPRAIPSARSLRTDADMSLSTWHLMADVDGRAGNHDRALREAVSIHAGHVSRRVGNHAAARDHARQVLRASPWSRPAWRLLALGMLGDWTTSTLKAALGR